MELEFFNPNPSNLFITLGKNGDLRLKKHHLNIFNIEVHQYFKIGKAKKGNDLYFIKTDDKKNFKVKVAGNGLCIPMGDVVEKTGIKTGKSYKYELFKDGNYEGFKLLIK